MNSVDKNVFTFIRFFLTTLCITVILNLRMFILHFTHSSQWQLRGRQRFKSALFCQLVLVEALDVKQQKKPQTVSRDHFC